MNLIPKENTQSYFKKKTYPVLGIYSNGYYLTLNDHGRAALVDQHFFTLTEEGQSPELTTDPQVPHAQLPEILHQKNRVILPGHHWQIGGDALFERIKMTKALKQLGFPLNPFDQQLIEQDELKYELLGASLSSWNDFGFLLSDQYNPASLDCLFFQEVQQNEMTDLIGGTFERQLRQEDQGSNWKVFTPVSNLPQAIEENLHWYLAWLRDLTDFQDLFQNRQADLERQMNMLRLYILTLIEYWASKAFSFQYTYASGNVCKRIGIHNQKGVLLLLCFDAIIH